MESIAHVRSTYTYERADARCQALGITNSDAMVQLVERATLDSGLLLPEITNWREQVVTVLTER